jgi:hypothetical protein
VLEEGQKTFTLEELALRYQPNTLMPDGRRIKDSRTFRHKGVDVLELQIQDGTTVKLVWFLAHTTKPIEEMTGYSRESKCLPIPLVVTDLASGMESEQVALDVARRKVQEEFDRYWKL